MEMETSRQLVSDLLDKLTIAKVGICEWKVQEDQIVFSKDWSELLGYGDEELHEDSAFWKQILHPEDLPISWNAISPCLRGESANYEFDVRLKKKDGSYIWTHNAGRVVDWTEEHLPVRILGGCLNTHGIKTVEGELLERLTDLEQDKMLQHVNEIAKLLVGFDESHDFHALIHQCLELLGTGLKQNRVYIWQDVEIDHVTCCIQVYEWTKDAKPVQGMEEFENIPYQNLPHFYQMTQTGACLNSQVKDLSASERDILEPQNIKSILVAPVSIKGKNWGFIGVDNCHVAYEYSNLEENTMLAAGFLMASAIQKYQTQLDLQEMEERTNLMLNATPLCCNLWNRQHINLACNDESLRLFELSNHQEYLDNFFNISPEYQPNGRKSSEYAFRLIDQAFEEGYCRFEWLHQKLNGEEIPTEVTLVRIKHKDDYIVAGYTRDLRELKAMLAEIQKVEDSLRVAHEEALLNSKAKTNFLANMSHEIRTPMNAIAGLAEIIIRDSKELESVGNAKGIKQACANLLNIINDILDISKIESGKLEINNSVYYMASLLNDTINISRIRLGSKPIQFITDIESSIPARLDGDEIRIRQILINILSNAIKFTSRGFIRFHASSRKVKDQVELTFEVTDSGQGISEADMKNLFQEFERVNTKRNRSIEGTGLGLAISKRLCEMMGGTITVTSTLDQGSTFRVVILQNQCDDMPLAKVDQPKRILLCESRELYQESFKKTAEDLGCICVVCQNQSELLEQIYQGSYDFVFTSSMHLTKVKQLLKDTMDQPKIVLLASMGEMIEFTQISTVMMPIYCLQLADMLNNRINDLEGNEKNQGMKVFQAPTARVLVVDDNSVNLQVAVGLMRPYEFLIDTALSGYEAIEKIRRTNYDLVFMDHMMPEMDGIDTTIAIRKIQGEFYQQVPIVALTANAIVGTREMFLKEGMNDFLPKPIELKKLNQILLTWIPKEKQIQEKVQESAKKSLGLTNQIQIEGIDVACGVGMLGGDCKNYMQILNAYYQDGQKKLVQLPKYLESGDLKGFRIDVHAIKGTSATIGAKEISVMAKALEDASIQENQLWIQDHVEEFLDQLQTLLSHIAPYVEPQNGNDLEPEEIESREIGQIPWLLEMISQLEHALEFADLSGIEGLLHKIRQYVWTADILAGIQGICRQIELFEYDIACEEAKRLVQICREKGQDK